MVTPEDLTTNADALVQQINTKSKQLDVLNQQLIQLQMGQKGDVATLEASVTTAQATLDKNTTGHLNLLEYVLRALGGGHAYDAST